MPTSPTHDLPAGLETLAELALDLRWTWSHEADTLWDRVDAEAWSRTRNPWIILQDISAERLRVLAADGSFVAEIERLARTRQAYLEAPSWFSSAHGTAALSGVAYFSMEFGLGEGLPLYAGGLGILAGDYLKTASDLGLPVSAWVSSIRKAISGKSSTPPARSTRPIRSTTRARCRSSRRRDRTAPGSTSVSTCPGGPSRCASGGRWSGVSSCTCSTPTTRSTARPTAASPASSTTPAPKSGSRRRSFLGSPAGGRSRRSLPRSRSAT